MKEYQIDNIPEYLSVIKSIQMEWESDELWYRGVEKTHYKLEPSLYRSKYEINSIEESDIYSQFIRKGKSLILNYNQLTKLDWYFLMQHYGCPTRLLDWTSGSLIALYFSIRNENLYENRCVYIIEPTDLNTKFHSLGGLLCGDKIIEEEFNMISSYLPGKKLPKKPIAIEPPFIDKRMFSQKSYFTIHGSSKEGIESLYLNNDLRIAKIIIKDTDGSLKEDLATTGITETTIFPDLEGLSRELVHFNAI